MSLIKTTYLSSTNVILKIIVGLILNKLIAFASGPSGIALFAHFQNFIQIISQVSQVGVLQGYTKLISRYHGRIHTVRIIRETLLTVLAASTSIVSFLVIGLSDFINDSMGQEVNYLYLIVFIASSLVFYNLGAYVQATLIGEDRSVDVAYLNIAQTLFLFIFPFPLAFYFGLVGAVSGLVLAQICWSLLCLFKHKHSFLVDISFRKFQFSKATSKRLFGYGVSGLVVAIISPGVLYTIRTISITTIGVSDVGIWQAVQSTSSIYMSVIAMVLSTFFYPKFSKISRIKKGGTNILWSAIATVCGLYFLVAFFLFFTKDYFFIFIFSNEFKTASDFVVYQLFSDFFRLAVMVMSYFLLAQGQHFRFISIEAFSGFSILFILIIKGISSIENIFFAYLYGAVLTFVFTLAMNYKILGGYLCCRK